MTDQNIALEGGTYEIIQRRLQKHADELRSRLQKLNVERKEVFGAIETNLLATDRITTQHNCIPRDMVAVGPHFLFGYNVHLGLKGEIELSDVFSAFRFDGQDHSFHQEALSLIENAQFVEDFQNLYKYYKDTVFAKFAVIGPHLYMVFQVGKGQNDLKTFKWIVNDDSLTYLGNRFDHEYRFPEQHAFRWVRTTREMQRRGKHPHISILDRVFVETVGGDLTIKVEDNTETGHGIYAEAVEHADQTLDDAEFYFANLGNLIVLKIRPYQEKTWRYLIFNEKMQTVLRVDSLDQSCVLLPDNQGIIFSNGYYLQAGDYKIFDNLIHDLQFEKRLASPNGEDFLYMFYQPKEGAYVLLPYNLVEQQVATPIICSGFSIFPDGELCYFRAEESPSRHHIVQVWQTPYGESIVTPEQHVDTYLYKIGNKDLVRGMAECNELLTLLSKGDEYGNLYVDLVRKSNEILDSYYWINQAETQQLNVPLAAVKEAAASAIDEFAKVRRLREQTRQAVEETEDKLKALMDKIRRYKPKQVDQFVQYLSSLRQLNGAIVGLKELRYIDMAGVEAMETIVVEQSGNLSEQMVSFLLEPQALESYQLKVAESKQQITEVSKVAEAETCNERLVEIGGELELLIEIVGNLKIGDATQTTEIIERISEIYSQLNGQRAQLKQKRQELQGTEAAAEYQAQIRLLDQALLNYLDLCDSPTRCEEYLTRMTIQLEELEGRFSEYETYVLELSEKREEIYNAFETRRLQLLETRNRRAGTLFSAGERILKGIANKLAQFSEANEINAYFAADLMVNKVRDIIGDLEKLEDNVKASDLQARLKTLREDAQRQLRDRKELFVDGKNVIRFGRHAFSVNQQELELTIVPRDGELYFHLSGTNFFQLIEDGALLATRSVWEMSIPAENRQVYRAEFLAFLLLAELRHEALPEGQKLTAKVKDFMAKRYTEGYIKGIHDSDATRILKALQQMESKMGLLRYAAPVRALAQSYWQYGLSDEDRKQLLPQIKAAGTVVGLFPNSREFESLQQQLEKGLKSFVNGSELFAEIDLKLAASYLFAELSSGDRFSVSSAARDLAEGFLAFLKKRKSTQKFRASYENLQGLNRLDLIHHWVQAYIKQETNTADLGYAKEVSVLLDGSKIDPKQVINVALRQELTDMLGEHTVLEKGAYLLDYHQFQTKLQHFTNTVLPMYHAFVERKKQLAEEYRDSLRLESFKPRVLSSFVRNQLIDEVYLPLIGDNLAKQIGTVGEDTRTDRMGMLLLISPPGYGKTTLMEYIANRLGLIFMKVNGPAIGHEVRSIDPQEAPNAAAREELNKLNLALEMGDNIMLYVDDIQHCHPEFLQKFISLCDAQRKIEGVYRGRTRTYDLRGKRVAVVMAGNPYTESGEQFQIPDMLANRADTYNLGDIIGERDEAFKRSYLENALTSNAILSRLSSAPKSDVQLLIRMAESGEEDAGTFESRISSEEREEYLNVLCKLLQIQEVILKVNQAYIRSAAQNDNFRTEPPFQLQGSYRNMNRLVEKVVPAMNDEELQSLISSHYEGESQTLSQGAEANFLRFRSLTGQLDETETMRWEEICQLYRAQKTLEGDRLAQLVQEMGRFAEGLSSIKDAIEKG